MTKLKLGAVLFASLLAGCTIYLDVEGEDDGPSDDDNTDSYTIDAEVPPCVGHWDEWGNWVCDGYPDAAASPWPDAGAEPPPDAAQPTPDAQTLPPCEP